MGRVVRMLVGMVVVGCVAAACADDETRLAATGDDVAEVSAPAAAPACAEIERFAEVMTDVSVTYDYTATNSPAELADTVDAVFGGQLTGQVTLKNAVAANDFDEQWYVGYEIRVDRPVTGSAMKPGGLATVFVFHGSHVEDVAHYEDAAAGAAGASVAVFAHTFEPVGEPVASIEGFVVACDGGPLLGWAGGRGEWASLAGVDDVLDAADTGAPERGADTTAVPDSGVVEAPGSIPTTSTAVGSDDRGGVDGPLMYGPKSSSSGGEDALVAGTVARDGDCVYVVADDDSGVRYPVLWPYGSQWRDDPAAVVLPDGTVLEVGDAFSAGGGYHDALTLTTERLAAPAVERARACAEGEWREVAIVHSVSKVE